MKIAYYNLWLLVGAQNISYTVYILKSMKIITYNLDIKRSTLISQAVRDKYHMISPLTET